METIAKLKAKVFQFIWKEGKNISSYFLLFVRGALKSSPCKPLPCNVVPLGSKLIFSDSDKGGGL